VDTPPADNGARLAPHSSKARVGKGYGVPQYGTSVKPCSRLLPAPDRHDWDAILGCGCVLLGQCVTNAEGGVM
jgi:hypothetical protein